MLHYAERRADARLRGRVMAAHRALAARHQQRWTPRRDLFLVDFVDWAGFVPWVRFAG